ncbi:MAG: DUF1732 domain-containing protein [Deltaproteobacteria bacterium]|nr:DUF1732 domain-containing protein [Deltaproteobacteria bacterium]
MIESMTGFGEHRLRVLSQGPQGKTRSLHCRVRSVNHRFLDVKLKLPRTDLMTLDGAVRKKLSELFKRGAVEVTLALEDSAAETADVRVNAAAAESYAKAARQLAKKLKLKSSQVSLDALLRLPGVVDGAGGSSANGNAFDDAFAGVAPEEIVARAVAPALQELKKTRLAEGAKLKAILIGHLDEMAIHLEALKRLEQPEKERARALLMERAQETLKLLESARGSGPAPSATASSDFAARLREEAVFWIERRDFAEERARLEMHLAEFRRLLTADPSGRKLEFIQQEILREINTLGTKSQSTAITTHTVELKTILERIREQLANVE